MPNLYRDTAGPAPATPPLDGDTRAEVAVVGAGVTGLSTALHLAERGIDVLLLDGEDPGWGASGRNGGQINPGLKHDPDAVEARFGADLGARMNALAGGAADFVFELIARHGLRCEARRGGTLRAAVHPRQVVALQATAAQLARRGAPVDLLGREAMAAFTGTARYAGGLLDRRGGDLNPLSFVRAMAAAAMAAGARVHGHSRAQALTPAAGRWRISTPGGNVDARHVVLATNGYSDDLWPGLRRSVVPLFGAIAATEALDEAVARGVLPGRSVLYESGAITVYYRVDAGRRLLIGGRGPQREIGSPAALGHLLRYAQRLWPALRGVTWSHAWSGRLAMTADHYPHVHRPAAGVWICLGYNGRGVALGTRLGAALADGIRRPEAAFDMPITPIAGIPLHRGWPLAVRAAMLRGRISDLFGF